MSALLQSVVVSKQSAKKSAYGDAIYNETDASGTVVVRTIGPFGIFARVDDGYVNDAPSLAAPVR